MNVYWPYIFYVLGLGTAILWPYFRVWLGDQQPFLWREAVVKFIGALVALLVLPNFSDLYANIGAMALNLAFAAGFAAGFAGHEVGRMAQAVNEARSE